MMPSASDDTDWDKVTTDEIPTDTETKVDEVPLPDLASDSEPNSSVPNSKNSDTKSAVEPQPEPKAQPEPEPEALQIVSIGTESNEYAFTFHKEALDEIMSKVSPDLKVSVVSVVGAFRTGKSFLLSWFLRYLNHYENLHSNLNNDNDTNTDTDSTTTSKKDKWYDQEASLGNQGFNWRGGATRNTTGIWMWSKPFILPRPNQENIAVLLVDTQGMFDHETTMGLTAAIFGLSTLLSSYQIYNVDKRIQEDNLQQLALFSEYGRLALQTGDGNTSNDDDDDDECDNKNDVVLLTEEEDAKELTRSDDNEDSSRPRKVNDEPTNEAKTSKQQQQQQHRKPFQKIEFLVRDWQNFEDDEDLQACEAEMENYLDTVLAERNAADLKGTREQIMSCFDDISCFLMTHPGFAVTRPKYSGEVDKVEPTFKSFMDRYCTKVFGGENLIPKVIHGRELTAMELGAYIQNYAKMFDTGAQFPEAATMLEATASANNSNATKLILKKYQEGMDEVAGPQRSEFLNNEEFEKSHRDLFEKCVDNFDEMANFGNPRAIGSARQEVIKSMESNYEMYFKLNEGRNPLLGFETFIIPLTIGFFSIVLRWIADFTCSSWSQTCKVSSEVLSHVYQVVFFFLVIVASTKAKQLTEALGRVKRALEVLSSGGSGTKEKIN